MRRTSLIALVAVLPGLLGVGLSLAAGEEDTPFYFFHSASAVGTIDQAAGPGMTFDEAAPTGAEPKVAGDMPLFTNGAPNAPANPSWTGSIPTRIGSLTLDVFYTEGGSRLADGYPFRASVWTKERRFNLGRPSWVTLPSPDPAVVHARITYDRVLGEMRFDIDPQGAPVTVELFTRTTAAVLYDSVDYPSGFSVGAPAPQETATPTPTPTEDGGCAGAPAEAPAEEPEPRPQEDVVESRSITSADLENVSFPTALDGFVGGWSGALFATHDGGATWTSVSPAANQNFRALDFPDRLNGYAIATPGATMAVHITRDGGANWTRCDIDLGISAQMFDAAFADAHNGIVVGKTSSPERPLMAATQDAGATWTVFDSPESGVLSGVSFAPEDPAVAFAAGPNAAFRTTDGGLTWVAAKGLGFAPDAQTIVALGASRALVGTFSGRVLETTDAGASWIEIARLGDPIKSLDVAGGRIFAAGFEGLLASSADDGRTWKMARGISTDLWGVAALTADRAVAVGNDGTVVSLRVPPPSDPAPTETYYLHPRDGATVIDVTGTFSTDTPAGETRIAPDVPGLTNSRPTSPYDPTWHGTIPGRIDTLSLDLWQKTSQDYFESESALTYQLVIWVGEGASAERFVFPFRVPPTRNDHPGRAQFVFSNINVDPLGEPVAISVRDVDPIPDASAFFYGSAEFPSSFMVNVEVDPTEPEPEPERCTPTEPAPPDESGGGSSGYVPAKSTPSRSAGPAQPSDELVAQEARSDEAWWVSDHQMSYPAVSGDGTVTGAAQWRVVDGTGNCCENYITVTSSGRIVDLGAFAPMYSDDAGETWTWVRNTTDQITCAAGRCVGITGGEGAVAEAPNGDIIAVSWDPWGGDHLISYKYNAAKDRWFYMHQVLKTPFFDRPWLSVIPGPITIGTETFPYIAALRGGWPVKGPWYYSTDGLNYLLADPHQESGSRVDTVEPPLPLTADAAVDWIQPNTAGGWAPLPGGGAIAAQMNLFRLGSYTSYLEPGSLRWRDLDLGDLPRGRLQADSRGWLHHLTIPSDGCSLHYRVSTDGGATWTQDIFDLPSGHYVEDFDFRVNGGLGMSAIAVRSHKDKTNTDQDLVFELDVADADAKLRWLYFVGAGDLDADDSFTLQDRARFDFPTIAIMPDGNIITSFADQASFVPVLGILTARPAAPTSIAIHESETLRGTYSDSGSVRVTLTDHRERPIDGAELSFQIAGQGGTIAGSAVTQEGIAHWQPDLTLPPGEYQLTVAYPGGGGHGATSAGATFTIDQEVTVSSLDVEGRGVDRVLIATLTEDDGPPVAGQMIAFFANDTHIGDATTRTDGRAIFEVPPRYRGMRINFVARFTGNEFYLPSEAGAAV